jgi:hypothetical protein
MFGTIVMRGLGGLLLLAAALKLYGLAVEPVGGIGIFSEPWLQTLIVEWEIALGIWLVWGVNRALAWLAAVATFVTFTVISASQGLIGQGSCGCLGSIRVNPWIAFGVDVASLALLGMARAQASTAENQTQISRVFGTLSLGGCGVLAILGAMAAISTLAFGSPDAGLAYLRGDHISILPRLVDVGEGQLGETKEITVTLRNWTKRPVRIIGGTADCACVLTKDLPLRVQAGESRIVTVAVDLIGEPGPFTRTGMLFTDDDDAPILRFRVTGRSHEKPQERFDE